MGENFAFFLPVMMATFSAAFLMAWRWGAQDAAYWSGGYALSATGFVIPTIAAGPDPGYWPLVADVLFATAFLFYGEALLQRWRIHWMLPLRIGLWGLSILICACALVARNLQLELAVSDLGCFLLIAVPLVAGTKRLDATPERVLFAAVCLVAFDTLFRATTVTLTIEPDGAAHFLDSGYAFLMQALACVFGLFMGLAGLAAAVVDKTARLREDAHVDPLSGLLNRRGFDHATMGRHAVPSGCVVTADIDHFKQVNDSHGHATGDRVIAAFAATIRDLLPPDGIAARFGGEEFILFLPQADAGTAARITDAIRIAFHRDTHGATGIDRPVSASFGLAVTTPSDYSLHDAIARADLALYDAKRSGRNRLCIWRSLEASPDSTSHVA